MKIKQFAVLGCFACLLFLLLTVPGCNGGNGPIVEGDNHFKVYHLKDGLIREIDVSLKDQFDKEPRNGKLSAVKFFANPVSKNEGKIPNPYAHLTWYKLKEEGPVIERIVTFKNQFGKEQRWIIGPPVYLLVPTKKEEAGTAPSKFKFNHFKCYKVLEGEFNEREVTLKDQFDKEPVKTVVEKPMFFCTPVQKNNEPIIDEEYHLACYSISTAEGEPSLPKKVKIRNQFGENRLEAIKSFLLCVPSKKIKVEIPDGEKNNHFKVYDLKEGLSREIDVTLKDQFGEDRKGKLSAVRFFANPVSKNEGKIPNPFAHLTWYKLEEEGPVIERIVTFKNQFGKEQRWIIGPPVYLLVPTKKEEAGTAPSKFKFNHFKCYKVLEGEFKKREVTLKDQFDKGPVKTLVEKPMFFCTPVQKNNEPIIDEKYHLACYSISPLDGVPSVPIKVKIKNQFGENQLEAIKSILLCVPSVKLKVE
jgi:hypothetical protein